MDVKPAQLFLDMAARIERTNEAEFAGAAVIVSPDGDSITLLLVDPTKDTVQFLSTLKSRVETEVVKVMQKAQDQQPGGWQRR